ncbi:MAG: hypothetical protein LUQ62_00835 [Methanomicrobiales archaeon]|nr:hypothetical protein [Methanomicrobiales archaeon]
MGPRPRCFNRFLLAVILLLALILSSGCTLPTEEGPRILVPGPSPTPPAETPATGTPTGPYPTIPASVSLPLAGTPTAENPPGTVTVRTFTFRSGAGTYTLSVPVREPPASAAPMSREDDCPMARWQAGSEGQVSSYYLGRIFSAEEEELYTALLRELSRIRRMEGLNDDEYLELVTNFIQQVPYDPDAPLCPRTPSAVIREGTGDCDEKSGLLLGLLSHEGYDVALLLFTEQHHATAGVRIISPTRPSFRVFGPAGRNYVYMETTGPALIGLYQSPFATAAPVVVPAGNGTTRYRAINDVMYIVGVQKRMEERMAFLAATGTDHLREINRLEVRLTNGTYDTRDEFDADYARYFRLITEYNRMGEDFQAIQEVYQFLRDHQYDRAGCRARIDNSKVELLL